jgi:MFS superfamily sulfate permease-like transporter
MERSPVNETGFTEKRGENRPLLFRIFFFSSFGFLLYQLLRIVSPFLEGILVAITLALVFYPVHARFLRANGEPVSARDDREDVVRTGSHDFEPHESSVSGTS